VLRLKPAKMRFEVGLRTSREQRGGGRWWRCCGSEGNELAELHFATTPPLLHRIGEQRPKHKQQPRPGLVQKGGALGADKVVECGEGEHHDRAGGLRVVEVEAVARVHGGDGVGAEGAELREGG
jgi:hypothetical protein